MKRTDQTHILLIEDNEADATLVDIYMREARMKCHLHHEETLYEGIAYIQEHHPDLVLLDLSLPDTTGFRTLDTFIEKNPSTAVVVMTGLNDNAVGDQAVKAGAQDYLIKGEFDGKLLGRVVRYAIQRHRIQQKLQETAKSLAISERRYKEAQEMANFGNFELDLVDNSMVWTHEMYRILGFSPRSITPTLSDYINCCHYDDRELLSRFLEDASKDGERHSIEHRVIRNGRSIRHILLHAKVYYEEINDKFFLVGGMQDITERKLGQQLFEEKSLQTHSSKLREKILEEMGFHIRTPLSSIQNIAYVLSQSEAMPQEHELMDGLHSSVSDLSAAINNMLNFSMLVSEKMEVEEDDIHLDDLIQQVNKMVRLKATQNKTQLNFTPAQDMPSRFKGDANKITQILYNLIDNGIKFTKENGRVDVQLSGSNHNDTEFNMAIEVKDNGVGMSSEMISELKTSSILQHLGETTQQPMGLAIVNKLVKTLEGQLDISSKEGVGSTFSVSLPLQSVKSVSIGADGKPTQTLKILLVEDHFLNQIATRKVLSSWSDKVTVDIADNGLVAVEKFKEHGYDLILMDLQMPIMNGMDAARKIREISHDVPIIALTANSSKSEAKRSREIGMNDYMSKPFKPEDLYANIMSVLSTAQTQ